ncbi:MAG: alpha-amylase family glycosyl hydrolase [Bacteroidota bacterium]
MLKRSYLTVAWLLLSFCSLSAQLITTSPAVPTADQPLTITFDATQGTGGLADCNCDVYLHTGVITEQSADPSDWQYVQTTWGIENESWRLTPVPGESNKYTFTFSPTVQDYFDPAIGETIEQVAFVFRNGNGSLEGKAAGGADIFVDIAEGGGVFSASLTGDPGNQNWPLGLALPVSGGASQSATLRLFDNDVEVANFTGTSFNYDLILTSAGDHTIRLDATRDGGETVSSSFEVTGELVVNFTNPENAVLQAALDETVSLEGTSYIDATLSLTEDGTEIATGTTSFTESITVASEGAIDYTITATYQGETASDNLTIIVGPPTVEAIPAGFDRGITRTDDGLFLQLYAPEKSDVFVIGNFNNWSPTAAARMKRTPDGETYWIELTDLPEGEDVIFQYLVDYELRVADPYSTLVLDPFNDPFISEATFAGIPAYPTGQTTGILSWVRMDPPDFTWTDDNFAPAPAEELTIYELLIRDFLEDHSFKSLLDTLDYLDRLGINAIELMPLNEFEGNISWGYNPSFHMALDKYYGSPEDLKAFVDACHERGIAVLLDVVFNHAFSQSSLAQLWWDEQQFRPASDNPYLNVTPRHPFNVGYDFNHESPATKDFVKTNIRYWIEEFHMDGFRFDLTKGFTQTFSDNDGFFRLYDAGRVAILKDYADECWATNNNTIVIFEHLAEPAEENDLAQHGNGIYFWSGFNPHNQYLEASMGYGSNLREALSINRGFTAGQNLIAYMESHDEERMMFKNEQFGNSSGDYDVTQIPTGLDRVELASAFFYTLPGPKMLWQFGELGYGFPINYCPNGTVNPNCRVDPKPIRWDYREENDRRDLYNIISGLLFLRSNYGTFHSEDITANLTSFGKTIHLIHPDFDAAIIGNFDVNPRTINNPFPSAGTWYDYFGGGSIEVTDPNAGIELQPGQYFVYLTENISPPEPGLPVSTQEIVGADAFQLQVSPNPTTGITQISYQLQLSGDVNFQLVDALGQTVQRFDLGTQGSGLNRITLPFNAPAGIYFLRMEVNGKIGTRRIVIQ